jgi:hypothetical protein
MTEKVCNKCQLPKPIEEFSNRGIGSNNFRARKADYWDPKKNTCKACDAEYAREFRKKNPGYRGSGKNKNSDNRFLMSAIRARINVCLCNQRKRGKISETDLTDEYLYDLFQQQDGKCRYSGEPMVIDTKHLLTLSLDKIIPDLGYMKGNVQWVCWAVNRAKGELKESDFLAMCRLITERCNDHPVRE